MNYTWIHNSFSRPFLRIFAVPEYGTKSVNGLLESIYSPMQNCTEQTLCDDRLVAGSHSFEDKQDKQIIN